MLQWNPDDLRVVVAVGVTTLSFVLYWFLAHAESLRSGMLKRQGAERRLVRHVLLQKYLGALLLGVMPALATWALLGASPGEHGLRWNAETARTSLVWVLGLATVLIPLNFFAARRAEARAHYPQIRVPEWDTTLLAQNAAAWIVYLLAYEYLFRGLLLFECAAAFGEWPAVVVSTALYSIAHVPKGFTEAIGAIPFGLVLGAVTLATGTIWVAVAAHVLLALSNDAFALYHNPEMSFRRG